MAVFNLGIIGAGGIARAHVKAATAIGDDVKVAAVVDPVKAARAAIADKTGAQEFENIEQLWRGDIARSLNGIIVCTPPSVRLSIVKSIIDEKIPVLVEKPLAHNLADAKKLAEMAKSAKTVTAVGYCHRFTPAMVEMKRRIDSGEVGHVVRFENVFAGWNPKMAEHWMSNPKVSGGGSFIDTGCHSIDLWHYLVGVGEVKSAVMHYEWPGRGDSNAAVMLKKNSTAGIILSGWSEPDRWTVIVVGVKQMLHFDFEHCDELLVRTSGSGAEKIKVGDCNTRFERQLRAFIAKTHGEQSQLATFEDGLKTAEMIDAALKLGGTPTH